jgi:hypothetical protein
MVTDEPSRKSRLSAQEHLREWNVAGGKSLLSRPRSSRAIQICRDCASPYRIGQRNSAYFKTRYDSMRIRSRIERLEDEMLPLPAGPPIKLNILAVNSEGKEVLAQMFEVPHTFPSGRRWRTTRWPRVRGSW